MNHDSSPRSIHADNNGMLYFSSLQELLQYKSVPKNFSLNPLQNYEDHSGRLKTLVCHDMQGGYLCYDSMSGASLQNHQTLYTFFHWWHIDIFVYFSHHFITIPPVVWTNQAHRHGVIMLGTFITEERDGFNLCKEIFASTESVDKLVDNMLLLCIDYGFDGWLINIENLVEPENLNILEYFLRKLCTSLKAALGKHSYVIWYDSIVTDGTIDYQNELNNKNKKWFNLVDGIFLNYAWKPENLEVSFSNAMERNYEVFVGVDVFGRGCFGNGGWNCCQALEIIRQNVLSVAIFAPGWISENFPDECLFKNSFRFWNLLAKTATTNRKLSSRFSTTFRIGYDCEGDWFCMNEANLQPFYLSSCNGIVADNNGLWLKDDTEQTLFLCNITMTEPLSLKAKTSLPSTINVYLNNGRHIELHITPDASHTVLPAGNAIIEQITITNNSSQSVLVQHLSLE